MVYYESNALCHYGIKGQKWGVRRFQNDDGTFTDAGKKRYFLDGSGENYKKLSRKEKKAEKQRAKMEKIDSDIKNAKSASEMESAMKKKVKEDIRASQNRLSRAINDLSGRNNGVAERVVEDISRKMVERDTQEFRSKMTVGQKMVDNMMMGSANKATSKYESKGYKNLGKEYEKYKSEGGIKKSKKNYLRDQRMARERAAAEARQRQREEERRYNENQRKQQEDIQRAVNNMNYLTKSFEITEDYLKRRK